MLGTMEDSSDCLRSTLSEQLLPVFLAWNTDRAWDSTRSCKACGSGFCAMRLDPVHAFLACGWLAGIHNPAKQHSATVQHSNSLPVSVILFTYNAIFASAQDCGVGVCSLVAVGARMWAGLHDGRVRVWEATPGVLPMLVGDWQAHDMAVIGLVLAGTRVSSLSADGSIKAWAATTPCDEDANARREIA